MSYENRRAIEKMCKKGMRVVDIAAAIGVHRATIYQELNRGGASGGNISKYSAEDAQKSIGVSSGEVNK